MVVLVCSMYVAAFLDVFEQPGVSKENVFEVAQKNRQGAEHESARLRRGSFVSGSYNLAKKKNEEACPVVACVYTLCDTYTHTLGNKIK